MLTGEHTRDGPTWTGEVAASQAPSCDMCSLPLLSVQSVRPPMQGAACRLASCGSFLGTLVPGALLSVRPTSSYVVLLEHLPLE